MKVPIRSIRLYKQAIFVHRGWTCRSYPNSQPRTMRILSLLWQGHYRAKNMFDCLRVENEKYER